MPLFAAEEKKTVATPAESPKVAAAVCPGIAGSVN
jgi:hypothetical protein